MTDSEKYQRTRLRNALVDEDICPECLGELDTGWECNECGYDATVVRETDEDENA